MNLTKEQENNRFRSKRNEQNSFFDNLTSWFDQKSEILIVCLKFINFIHIVEKRQNDLFDQFFMLNVDVSPPFSFSTQVLFLEDRPTSNADWIESIRSSSTDESDFLIVRLILSSIYFHYVDSDHSLESISIDSNEKCNGNLANITMKKISYANWKKENIFPGCSSSNKRSKSICNRNWKFYLITIIAFVWVQILLINIDGKILDKNDEKCLFQKFIEIDDPTTEYKLISTRFTSEMFGFWLNFLKLIAPWKRNPSKNVKKTFRSCFSNLYYSHIERSKFEEDEN